MCVIQMIPRVGVCVCVCDVAMEPGCLGHCGLIGMNTSSSLPLPQSGRMGHEKDCSVQTLALMNMGRYGCGYRLFGPVLGELRVVLCEHGTHSASTSWPYHL